MWKKDTTVTKPFFLNTENNLYLQQDTSVLRTFTRESSTADMFWQTNCISLLGWTGKLPLSKVLTIYTVRAMIRQSFPEMAEYDWLIDWLIDWSLGFNARAAILQLFSGDEHEMMMMKWKYKIMWSLFGVEMNVN